MISELTKFHIYFLLQIPAHKCQGHLAGESKFFNDYPPSLMEGQ